MFKKSSNKKICTDCWLEFFITETLKRGHECHRSFGLMLEDLSSLHQATSLIPEGLLTCRKERKDWILRCFSFQDLRW